MEIILNNRSLKVFEDGMILVKKKEMFYEKKCCLCHGYKQLQLYFEGKRKFYLVHRIVAHVYLGLDIENPKQIIDHIDRNTLNNNVSNLRIVTHQQNQFNTNAKGYTWYKRKWKAYIKLNGKKIHLGYFEKEEDASKAYKDAKLIHHII